MLLPDGSSLLVERLAKTTFDGQGNTKKLDPVAVNGNLPPDWRLSKGTYSVDPDCTGSFSNDPEPPIHVQMTVSQHRSVSRLPK